MARSDLLLKLVKAGIIGDSTLFRKTVEAIAAEERAKQHNLLADKLMSTLVENQKFKSFSYSNGNNITNNIKELFWELIPEKKMSDLILNEKIKIVCNDLLEEHYRSDLLRSYGMEPRHRILLAGPPGNGKTSLAEALAESLSIPLFVVRYESLIGSYLGETSSRLKHIFEYSSSRRCVLFFDEFDTIGKERGDKHETGEIKRVVSSLLMQIDKLPSHVIIITASNHPELLDKAVWRRFQVKLFLPKPSEKEIEKLIRDTEKKLQKKFKFPVKMIASKLYGASFAEIQDFCDNITRKFILSYELGSSKEIVQKTLEEWEERFTLRDSDKD